MSDLLSIGASGVRAYQTALTTTSENIANAGNASYVRRSATIREVQTSNGWNSSLNGMGAVVDGIARNSSPYLEASVRSASSDAKKTEASTVWLERIEGAMTGGALSTNLTGFFAASTALQAEPTSSALRAGMLGSAATLADSFKVTAKALDDGMAELDTKAQQTVGELNRLSQALLKVNQGIVKSQPGSAAAAGLADQRDDLLQQMSALTEVNVQVDDFGRATVRAGASNGPVLVDPKEASEMSYARTGGNAVLNVLKPSGVAVQANPEGGALAGMVEGAQRIAATRDQLGAIAADLTTSVNDLQKQGQDLTGAQGKPFFANTSDPADFSVALTDGSQIAAAKTGGGVRDSSNLAALAALRTGNQFESKVQALTTDNAATLKQRRLVGDAQTAIYDGAVTARSEASGVNLDSEAVDLVRFQQAYQASSRVIQVARETFQSILEIR
ncbi:flagellar hook-associated protein FlgK [Sphingomonas sp. BK069]|uniref:flagellar hook-associated protein FlgK n=1 Tax=Sphingomonas sp. BK069 TaxID=2586979 RepID=UPI00161CE532|nr:flagellar hook-associated protein FlgK [Sphingomonas sp. BK069]MBB3347601.1 flagellar hook-associated protein 1 FlgK [Sphingomonas sp. BK069]